MIRAACAMRVSRGSALNAYLAEIKADLRQVENLLADATATLLAAFTSIAESVGAQKRLATELAAACAAGEGRRASRRRRCTTAAFDRAEADEGTTASMAVKQAALVDQVEQQFDGIVRALQSQDLTAQLLAHADSCLAGVQAMLGLSAEPTAPRSVPAVESDAARPGDGGERICRATAEIIVFPRSKAVYQRGMQTGDIELF